MTSRPRLGPIALSIIMVALTITPAIPGRGHAQAGIFKITLMVPQPNPGRQAWSLVVQSNLQALGIDAQRVVLDWNTIYSLRLPDCARLQSI